MDIFFDVSKTVRKSINDFVDMLLVDYGDFFEAVSNAILTLIVYLEKGLKAIPAPMFIVALMAIAYMASRRISLTIGVGLGLFVIGCLGQWDKSMQTITIMLVAMIICIVIGIPMGILSAKSRHVRSVVSPILDLMQTIPSFVYLVPAILLFGLGKVSAIFATVIYAVPPLIRLVDLGIREVDKEVVEACQAFGGTRLQMLTGVQIPLALPTIMQGINQMIMMALAMVVIASMVGARGVGETVLQGLTKNDVGMGFIGGAVIVILAVILDRITQSAGMRLQSHRI